MVLIDSSVWIESFRRGSKLRISRLFAPEEIHLALPIYQEILQGIRDEAVFLRARTALAAAVFVENPLSIDVHTEAVELYRLARSKGITPRSSVDCLIAVCAMRNNLTVIHRDRDYKALARVSALKEKQV